MMSRRRRLLFALATILLFLGGVEGLARLLPTASDAASEGAALRFDQNPELQEGNARFWQPDPLLFWRMRPDLDVDFGGMPLRTNAGGFRDPAHLRDPGRPLVICLGDSTTFGWGVLDVAERFSNLLGSNQQVFNFGQSGYSSVQGQRLLENEALPLNPAAVIFLFGPNDYAQASGRTDRDQPVAGEDDATVRLQSVLHHSAFYRRVAAALVKARDRNAADAAGSGSEAATLRRVPMEEFKQNLHEMIVSTREAGANPILATYPRRPLNPLLPCPPPATAAAAAAAEKIGDWAGRVHAEAAPLLETVGEILAGKAGSPPEALARWRGLPPEARQTASGLYGEAWLLQQAGQSDEAEELLALATERAHQSGCGLDLFSTRLFRYLEEPAAAAYNQAIREVAGEQAVPLVDAAAILTAAQLELAEALRGTQDPPSEDPDVTATRWRTGLLARWFGGDSYFVDVVHPSAHGHAVMAAALNEALAREIKIADQ